MSSPSSVCRGTPIPYPSPCPAGSLGPPRRQTGWGGGGAGDIDHCAPSSSPLSRPWPSLRSGCCSSWGGGGGGMRGVLQPSPRGPCGPGPVLDLARPTAARFNPPSRPPGTHPDTQDLPAASAHPGWALPGAAPRTPLASHHCCPPTRPVAPRRAQLPLWGSLVVWARGTPTSTVKSPADRQTDLRTHCHRPWVPLLKEHPELTLPSCPRLPWPEAPAAWHRLGGHSGTLPGQHSGVQVCLQPRAPGVP